MYHFDVVYEVKKNALCCEHNAGVLPSAPTLLSSLKPLVALTSNSAQQYYTESSRTSKSHVQIHQWQSDLKALMNVSPLFPHIYRPIWTKFLITNVPIHNSAQRVRVSWDSEQEGLFISYARKCYNIYAHNVPRDSFIHSLVFSLEGRAWQEPQPSHVTGMALPHCILGKILGVVCHCFPTLAARCLRSQRRERS